MNTLRVLLWKDLRRAWRNPIGWLVFLLIPLVITALVGMAFGPKSDNASLGRIRFAMVDEDDTPLTRFLKGAVNQGEGGQYLEPVVLERAEALKQVRDEKLSAVLIIPEGFTHDYLATTNVVTLELIKNPAESIHPAVLEELLGVVVTGLDAVKRNFGDELPAWNSLFETGDGSYHRVAELIVRAGDRIEAARKMLFPPRVSYTNAGAAHGPELEEISLAGSAGRARSPLRAAAIPGGGQGTARPTKGPSTPHTPVRTAKTAAPASHGPPAFNIFGYLLPGLASMFLLFLGDHTSRDLQHELQHYTLQRYRTLHHRLFIFVVSKGIFCFVLLLLAGAVMMGGGGLIFRIHWRHPLIVTVLTGCYCLFASGLMMLLPAMLGDHRAAQALGNITAMLIGLAGGSTFPVENLPGFLRNSVAPLMPNYWYSQAVRGLSYNDAFSWTGTALKLALVGLVLGVAAAVILQRKLAKGARG